MSSERARELIVGGDLAQIDGFNPLAEVESLNGVRVYDVGQGDSIAILDNRDRPVLQIDYGGRQDSPFRDQSSEYIDKCMPAGDCRLVMVTHWDEDHWCSAARAAAVRGATWLVPRQVTSPRAVRFSTELTDVSCIPESRVGQAFCFKAMNGDEVWWEKIAASEPDASKHEDCNRTGVALAVVKRTPSGEGTVILVPGDAPFGRVRYYEHLRAQKLTLRGLVAFHHGSRSHWTEATRRLLRTWPVNRWDVRTVFSCSRDNPFRHPHVENYEEEMGETIEIVRTPSCRVGNDRYIDIAF